MTDEKLDIEKLMTETKRPPKDPRASARSKLRRRLIWLQSALHNADLAIDEVFDAPGRTNKKDQLQLLKDAIKGFRDATGLKGDGLPDSAPISDEACDLLLMDEGVNWSAYTANVSLIATLDLSVADE